MNMFKKNGGFTLVELVVVIAILAILAGVAVPAYSGYIARANDAAVVSELAALQTAAQSACAMNGKALEQITVTSAGAITVAPAAGTNEVAYTEFYNGSNLPSLIAKHSEYSTSGAKWTAAKNVWEAGN